MKESKYPLTLYYDASCRLCAAEMHNLRLRDTAGRLRFVDCSAVGFHGGPAPQAALMAAMHAVDADGHLRIGVPALRAAYAAAGLARLDRLLGWPPLARWAGPAYAVLARHRHRLPAWLVAPLFEQAARRAARRAGACRDGACTQPGGRAPRA